MNSSVLVSGFVIVGVGAMAFLFNPFGSSDNTSPNSGSTYQVSANSSKVGATSPVSATASAGAKSSASVKSEPEPFSWDSQKETVVSTEIVADFGSRDATEKVSKPEKRSSGLGSAARSKALNASKNSTPKQQTVSRTASNFGDQTKSTVDGDLNDFFGQSKPATRTTTTKAPQARSGLGTKPAVAKAKSEPVRVASKPAVDSARSTTSWPTQEVKTTKVKGDDIFSFSDQREKGSDDAPMLADVKMNEEEAPSFEPNDETKAAPKTESSGQNISGSFESAYDEPQVATPVVKELNIENPLQTRLNVTFLVDGKKVSLKPGQHFVLRQSEDALVKFSRGGSFGFEEKSLSEGKYQFSVTRKDGWKLTK